MLSNILRRKDVCDVVSEILSADYSNKKDGGSICYCNMSKCEQVLFTFFDALFKYQIIIETDVFLDEYIVQLRKLFKKVTDLHDINLGIAKIIGKICALKLDITLSKEETSKLEIVDYVYDKYIVNGYLFHGYSGVYRDQIKRYGFSPEKYQHSYTKFMDIKRIFKEHDFSSVINKNFQDEYVEFTDSFIMGCYYGANSPMYFYQLLGGSEDDLGFDREAYFKNDYFACFNNLNKLVKEAKLSSFEKKYVTKICLDEWKSLEKNTNNINILMIKREVLGCNFLKDIDDIKNSTCDLGELLFKIFNSRSNNIVCKEKIEAKDILFVEIPSYNYLLANKERIGFEKNSSSIEKLNNAYGSVSILILLGSLFIALGVIFTIITIGKGM